MSEMNSIESIERVREGLKKAASCARQLSKIQKSNAWEAFAVQLDNFFVAADALASSGVISEVEAEAMIQRLVATRILSSGGTTQQ